MASWLVNSAVPGMLVPGAAIPGNTANAGGGLPTGPWLYLGHVPACYLDYVDTLTQQTLTVVVGGSYNMLPVNSRAGLTVPPPDNCWLAGGTHFAPRLVLVPAAEDGAVQLARARAHSARLHARMARGERVA